MASTEERLARVEEQVQEQLTGFAELREDIHRLEQRMDTRFAAVEQRFQYLEQRFDARFDTLNRHQMTTLLAIISGFAAVLGALLTR